MAKKKLPEVPDAQVLNGGSVFLVTPHTDAAREWIKKNVGEEAQFFGYSLWWNTATSTILSRGCATMA